MDSQIKFLRIETLTPKRLIGKSLDMSIQNNRTVELWRSFMPQRKELSNVLSNNLFSLQVHHSPFKPEQFSISEVFTKWALVEVKQEALIPEGMKEFNLPTGQYAVFLYKGPSGMRGNEFHFIYEVWLKQSNYVLDHRPHFEVLGEKFNRNSPESEEEIFIPVKNK